MTTKKKAPPAKQNNVLRIGEDITKSEAQQRADVGISPTVLNSLTAVAFTKHQFSDMDLTETVRAMRDKVNKVNAGDVTDIEATLTTQAVALNAIFNELARRAALNMGEYINATETYMRLALKAQAQCARTIEVIATMKNPPVVFAKQANISQGHQQVNNGNLPTTTHAPAHAEKVINQPNELLSEVNNATLDTARAATASRTN